MNPELQVLIRFRKRSLIRNTPLCIKIDFTFPGYLSNSRFDESCMYVHYAFDENICIHFSDQNIVDIASDFLWRGKDYPLVGQVRFGFCSMMPYMSAPHHGVDVQHSCSFHLLTLAVVANEYLFKIKKK